MELTNKSLLEILTSTSNPELVTAATNLLNSRNCKDLSVEDYSATVAGSFTLQQFKKLQTPLAALVAHSTPNTDIHKHVAQGSERRVCVLEALGGNRHLDTETVEHILADYDHRSRTRAFLGLHDTFSEETEGQGEVLLWNWDRIFSEETRPVDFMRAISSAESSSKSYQLPGALKQIPWSQVEAKVDQLENVVDKLTALAFCRWVTRSSTGWDSPLWDELVQWDKAPSTDYWSAYHSGGEHRSASVEWVLNLLSKVETPNVRAYILGLLDPEHVGDVRIYESVTNKEFESLITHYHIKARRGHLPGIAVAHRRVLQAALSNGDQDVLARCIYEQGVDLIETIPDLLDVALQVALEGGTPLELTGVLRVALPFSVMGDLASERTRRLVVQAMRGSTWGLESVLSGTSSELDPAEVSEVHYQYLEDVFSILQPTDANDSRYAKTWGSQPPRALTWVFDRRIPEADANTCNLFLSLLPDWDSSTGDLMDTIQAMS